MTVTQLTPPPLRRSMEDTGGEAPEGVEVRFPIVALPACGGLVGLSGCPGLAAGRFRPDRLGPDLDAIADWKAEAVLCLLRPDELAGLDLSRLGHETRIRGIGWLNLALPDAPGAAKPWQWCIIRERLTGALKRGSRILIHAAHGTERPEMLARHLLMAGGSTRGDAEATVTDALERAARGLPA